MNKLFQHIGSLSLGGFGAYYFSNPVKPNFLFRPIPSHPPTVHIHKEISSSTALTTLAVVATGGFCYWNGIGFADIAYATRRSVETLSKQLEAAKVSILNKIKTIENQLKGTEKRLDKRIVDEAKLIRDNIEALHKEHHELSQTVDHIDKKVTNIEALSLYSSKGVALLCDSTVKSSGFLHNFSMGPFFRKKPTKY